MYRTLGISRRRPHVENSLIAFPLNAHIVVAVPLHRILLVDVHSVHSARSPVGTECIFTNCQSGDRDCLFIAPSIWMKPLSIIVLGLVHTGASLMGD